MSNTVGRNRNEDTFHTIEQHAQTACFYCAKKPDHQLSACSRCSRVSYCDPTCQSSDFPIHKKICKIWKEIRSSLHPSSSYPFLTSFPPSANEITNVMRSMSVEMMGPLMVRLGQKGGMVANYLVFSEPRCQRCLKVGGLGAAKKLEGCEECVVRWCGGEEGGDCKGEVEGGHKESGLCRKLKEIAGDELVIRAFELSPESHGPGSNPVWSPERVLRVETPLPQDWTSYLNSVRDPSHASPVPERMFVQHSLSLPLTIVASLKRFGLFSKFSNPKDLKTLTVHLIGAEAKYEMACVGMAYEEILHLLPGVKDLKIVLVGPSLGTEQSDEVPMDCCRLCRQAGRKRSIAFHPTTYHDFLRSHRSSPSADLAIAFNSGCHEEPANWSPTLSVLLANRTPTVFTSFNELEAKEDAKVITRKAGAGVEWVWREEKNEWRSGRRHFDLFSGGGGGEQEPIWSENGFWLGFRGV